MPGAGIQTLTKRREGQNGAASNKDTTKTPLVVGVGGQNGSESKSKVNP